MIKKPPPNPPCKPKTQEKCKRLRVGQCIECGGTGKKKASTHTAKEALEKLSIANSQ